MAIMALLTKAEAKVGRCAGGRRGARTPAELCRGTLTPRATRRKTYFGLSLVSLPLLRLVLGMEWTEELFLLEECDECEE